MPIPSRCEDRGGEDQSKGLNYSPSFLLTYNVEVSMKAARDGRGRTKEHTGTPRVVMVQNFTTSG